MAEGRRGGTALDSRGHHPGERGGLGVNRNGGLAVGGCEDRDICAVAARATLRKIGWLWTIGGQKSNRIACHYGNRVR